MTVINAIDRIAGIHPDGTAVIHRMSHGKKAELTWHQLAIQSCALARHLRALGMKPGDLVCIAMQRCIEHVITMLAVLRGGGAFASLNPRLTPKQIETISGACNSPFLVLDSSGLIRASNLEAGCLRRTVPIHFAGTTPLSPVHRACKEKLGEAARIETFLIEETTAEAVPEDPVRPLPTVVGRDAALALFTSGSTGQPKGVLVSHQDLVNRVAGECRDFRLTASDRLLNLLPFSFDVGLNQLFTALTRGIQLVLTSSWLARDICSAVEEHGITGISGVPTLWNTMLAHDDTEAVQRTLDRLRYLTISGGDMSRDQLIRLRQAAPRTGIYKTYGQTEAFRGAILFPEEFDEKMTTVGRPVDGTDVFVLSADGGRAAPDEPGEIIHRGDGVMVGYVGDPEGTRGKLKGNPLQPDRIRFPQQVIFTGDIGKMDADGYLTVLGRRDRMLKIRGNRVYPKEILDVVLSHEHVQDAVVFGVRDEVNGHAIHAEVQLRNGRQIPARELASYLARHLPSYMVPAKIIPVDSFPRTASGKIRLSAVEEKYGLGAAQG